jgi:16S rRNA (adenine1518-N6/adenine1519-N6)-dimethyltransferase
MKLIDDHINVDKIVVMVQKEVGDRFKAKPKSKEYGSLTVFLNYYFEIKKIMDVSKNVFMPKPNVDSIVVEFSKTQKNYEVNDEELFFKIVKDSFKQKRKTIKNNLREYNLDIIENVLKQNGFSLSSRAEEIPIEVFIKIANELSDSNDK